MIVHIVQRDWSLYPLHTVTRYMWLICPPILFLLGTFGNLMTIVITRRMASKQSTINIYFTAVAVTDALFLPVMTVPAWLKHLVDYDLVITHAVVCKMYTWIRTGTASISCWYLVCMTVHRAMSVVWPHRVSLLCTRRTVLLVLAGIAVFFAALFSHVVIWFDKMPLKDGSGYACQGKSEDYIAFAYGVFAFIDMTVYCVLPFIILMVSNCVLAGKLHASVKAVGRQLTQGDCGQVQAREKAASSVTLTVMVVSSAFLVLTLPNGIFHILNKSGVFEVPVDGDPQLSAVTRAFFYDLSLVLGTTNGAVNFYLYCLTGRRFREEFIRFLTCGRNRPRRGVSTLTGDVSKQSTLHSQPSSF